MDELKELIALCKKEGVKKIKIVGDYLENGFEEVALEMDDSNNVSSYYYDPVSNEVTETDKEYT